MKRKWMIAAGLGAIVIGWIVFDQSSKSNATPGDISWEMAKVEKGDVQRIVSASGAVRALRMVDVGSEISGRVIELHADFNDKVTTGQLLAKIDPQNFESRVRQVQADLTSSKANLNIQLASISKAKTNLDNAKRDFERQSALIAEKAISESLFEDAKQRKELAEADLIVANAQLERAKADVLQREANLDTARADLERTNIRSPIDGIVIVRNVDIGQTVAASLSAPLIFQIAQDLTEIRIDAAVVEADIGIVNKGDTARFTVDAYPGETFSGVVEQVRLSALNLQNVVTYTVVIAARNPDGRLLPGMTANVEIVAELRRDVLRVTDDILRFTPPKELASTLPSAGGGRGDAATDGGGGMGAAVGGAPAGGMAAAGGGAAGGGATRSPLGDMVIDAERKKLIDEEFAKESAAFREQFATMARPAGGAAPGGAPDPAAQQQRDQMRAQMTAMTERVLSKYLTSEEMDTWRAAQAAAAFTKTVTVYKLNDKGALEPVRLTIGLADGQNVEIIRGAEVGEELVLKAVVANKS